ncbi:O-antigen ligase family protein [Occallatibacter savannae]|uniref:O-antigen ligase family protein n=1 Tax=Occallatibacter savannae TaxID=1002691 RepID=UPI000D68F187|nr:O-antigen ligase family protein [Occallatibacter savannae]
MSTLVAFTICAAGVIGLFYLNRDGSAKSSKALWLPVIWLMIIGSRPLSMWLGVRDLSSDDLASTLEGSSVDAAFYAGLMFLALVVLIQRRKKTAQYLVRMSPIVLYSVYCLISVTWAPYTGPAFKRWAKDVGDVMMALIVATDANPIEALQDFFSRIGFVLLPFSVFMIRYTATGRVFDPEGGPMNVGVNTNKNTLGLIVYIVALGTLWTIRRLLADRNAPHRKRRLFAQFTLMGFGIVLLWMAHSSTSIACFLLGGGLIVATNTRAISGKPARVHALCAAIVIVGAIVLLIGGMGTVAGALGRQSTLSGRTLIWAALLPAASNPLFGAGFDSFWTSPDAKIFHRNLLNWYHAEQINEAHNGYIEVYLNLGWVGVVLIGIVLLNGYRRAVAAFRYDRSVGGLLLAFVVGGAFYGITEAGFRTMTSMWIMLLTSIVCATGASSGLWAVRRTRSKAKSMSVSRQAGYGEAFAANSDVPLARGF